MLLRTFALPGLAILSLALPGVAVAKGGGGTVSPPPPTSAPPVLCDYALDGLQADGSSIFSNQAGDAGCVTVRAFGSTLRLYAVTVTPGWVYTVTSNGEG